MRPNHPYSYPPAHTIVTMHLNDGTTTTGYHDGGQFWFNECDQVELRVRGWEPRG